MLPYCLLTMNKQENPRIKGLRAFKISHCEVTLFWKVLLASAERTAVRLSLTHSQTARWEEMEPSTTRTLWADKQQVQPAEGTRMRVTSPEELESHKQPVSPKRKAKEDEIWKVRQRDLHASVPGPPLQSCTLCTDEQSPEHRALCQQGCPLSGCAQLPRTTLIGLEKGNMSGQAAACTAHPNPSREGHLCCLAPP